MVTPREAQVPPTSLAAFFTSYASRSVDFCFGDLLHLFDRHVRDEVHLGLAGAGLEAGLVFDQFGRRRDADLDREGAVVVVYSTVTGTSMPSNAAVSSLICATTS